MQEGSDNQAVEDEFSSLMPQDAHCPPVTNSR